METEALTHEERTALTLDALVNWCWNTKVHLDEARRMKALKARRPRHPHWENRTKWLLERMHQEVCKAEVDTAEVVLSWNTINPSTFLDAIPDES